MAQKNSKKDPSEKPTPEQLKKVKKNPPREKKPPFPFPPEEPEKEDSSTGSPMEEKEIEEEDFQPLDIEEFCQDMVGAAVEIGCIFLPKMTPLDPKQKKLIGKPLSKVIIKHRLDKACKEEFVLIAAIGFVAYKKITEMQTVKKEEKKPDERP